MTIEIIAEIGVNHNGDFKTAVAMVKDAWMVGADTAKFQLFRGDRYPELQLAPVELKDLKDVCEKLKMKFLCTPDTIEDARDLVEYVGVDRIKIGSSNVTNIPLLQYVAKLDVDVILSTGACTLDELNEACDVFEEEFDRLTVMHCVSAYPSPVSQLNLVQINHLWFGKDVGYSDHTIGTDYQSALVAMGLGARIFEKHFTLGHHLRGPDHKMSADIHEMKRYVSELRLYAQALGDGKKQIMPCEEKNRAEYLKFVEVQK